MKGFGLVLALAIGAAAWAAMPTEGGPVVTAGIEGGNAPHSDCFQAGGDWLTGCEGDELTPHLTAGIHSGGAPHSDCVQAGADWLSGCEGDELRRITVASIDGSD